jgi:hypothetical protein
MPVEVIVTVGIASVGVAGGVGVPALGGGVGAAGDHPPEHPAINTAVTTKTKRRTTGNIKDARRRLRTKWTYGITTAATS